MPHRVLTWRNTLGQKYSDLLGVRITNFLWLRHMMGQLSWKSMRTATVRVGRTVRMRDSSVSGIPTETYKDSLTTEKMANMITLYDRFIPPNCRPDYLPSQSTATCSTTSTSASQLQQVCQAHHERESRASAPRMAVMAPDTKILPGGLKVTPPKPAAHCKESISCNTVTFYPCIVFISLLPHGMIHMTDLLLKHNKPKLGQNIDSTILSIYKS